MAIRYVNAREAAKILGLDRAQVLRLRRKGRVKGHWNGEEYRFPVVGGSIAVLPGKKRGRKPKRLEGEAALARARARGVGEGRLVEALDGLESLRGEGVGPSTE